MKGKEIRVFCLSFLSLLCAISLCNQCKGGKEESTTSLDTILENNSFYNVKVGVNSESMLDYICSLNRVDSVYISFSDGRIKALFISIEENIDPILSIPVYHNAIGFCPYRCYSFLFDDFGHLSAMGALLFGQEGPDSDFSFEFGEWRYYDSNGKQRDVRTFY